jgi:catalase
MSPAQQQVLFDNTAAAMGDALDFIKQRHIDNCTRCDPAYGAGVAAALGMTARPPAELPAIPELAE